MKKLKILVLSVLTFVSANTHAFTRSYNEAETIAQNTLANSGNITLVDVMTQDGDTLAYTFEGEIGGFAIIPADARFPELLAYSKDGNVSDDVKNMLDVLMKNADGNLHKNMDMSESADDSPLRATRITNSPIEPLLKKISWGQEDPFNLTTPVIDDVKSPTGCSATAIAQLMFYYRYPSSTLADIPAYTTKTNQLEVAAVAKGTQFDWDNMLDTYGFGYTDEQASEVSNLMSVVGAAIEMDYGKDESTCAKTCVDELVNIFGYDPDLIRLSYRSSFSFAEWSQLIYDELKNNRPVLMAGSTMISGHRFLCDRIDENGLFHINWGWGGSYDGYFDMAMLNPNTTTATGASISTDGYSKDNYIVYGIQPDNGVADARKESTLVESLSVKLQVSNGKAYLFFSYANPSLEKKTVMLASGYVDEDGTVVKTASIGEYELNPTSNYNQLDAYALNFSTFKEDKIYKIGMIESTDGKNWTPCDGFNNVNYAFTLKNGAVSVVDNYELSASVEFTDFNRTYQYAHGVIHLSNAGSKEYYNTLYLMTNSENERPSTYSYAAFVTAEAGDSNDVDFKFVPTSDTVYYWVMDVNMNVVNNGVVYKGHEQSKIVASVKIDTVNADKHICRVYLKNEGKTYYDNEVGVYLYYNGGLTKNFPDIYLRPGDETTVSFEVPSNFDYTRYVLYDYNGEIIVNDYMNSTSEGVETVYMSFDLTRYETSDKTVVGSLIVDNCTSESHVATYKIEMKTDEDQESELLASLEVDVPAHSVVKVPFSLLVGVDSCEITVYREDDTKRIHYNLKADSKDSVFDAIADSDDSNLKIWTVGTTLMVEALDDVSLQVAHVNGCNQIVRPLSKGEIFTQELPVGVYVVNKKKILIR